MSNINTGGPAFPVPDLHNNGMTLRDYFAAKAMQALLTKQGPYGDDVGKQYRDDVQHVDELAGYAYIQADAMLKARKGGAA